MENSPYTPGAGHTPPVLAGRDRLLRNWSLVLNDVVTSGRVRAEDLILVGPRGVGKTVTVSAFANLAREPGFEVVNLQAVAGRPGLVDALLQRAQARIAEEAGPWRRARAAFERLGGANLSVAGFGGGISMQPRQDSGQQHMDGSTLAEALATLATEVSKDSPRGGLLVTLDEMQVASRPDLTLLAATLQRLNIDYPTAPVIFAGTGLPNTPAVLSAAGVTHPDRLFVLETIPLTLDDDDARYALVEPARQRDIGWEHDAAAKIVEVSNGYPAHLQVFAHHTWTVAPGPDMVTLADVDAAIPLATAQLQRRSLGPRWDRITDKQMEYLAALAMLGGRASTALVADALGNTPKQASWIREQLIEEGDIYAPRRGQVAMAVPLFSDYVLSNYEQARSTATIPLLSLDEMANNASMRAGVETNLTPSPDEPGSDLPAPGKLMGSQGEPTSTSPDPANRNRDRQSPSDPDVGPSR